MHADLRRTGGMARALVIASLLVAVSAVTAARSAERADESPPPRPPVCTEGWFFTVDQIRLDPACYAEDVVLLRQVIRELTDEIDHHRALPRCDGWGYPMTRLALRSELALAVQRLAGCERP